MDVPHQIQQIGKKLALLMEDSTVPLDKSENHGSTSDLDQTDPCFQFRVSKMIHLPFVEISTIMHVSPSGVIRAFPPRVL